jgi:hypothetical protein
MSLHQILVKRGNLGYMVLLIDTFNTHQVGHTSTAGSMKGGFCASPALGVFAKEHIIGMCDFTIETDLVV